MPEQSSLNGSWMDEITPKTETLKIKDGQLARFIFKNAGVKKESEDYGSSIAFLVQVDGEQEQKTFYVKSNNFDLLCQIKELAKANNNQVVNLHCEISRIGSKKSDTRYKILKL